LGRYVAETVEITAALGTATAESGINISDAVTILKQIVGLTSLTGNAAVAADVNGDGSINISDAVTTLKTIVGLESNATMVLVDASGNSSFDVGSGVVDLTAVVLGDVDGSYADII